MANVPPSASVLVVSKGDQALLQLENRRTAHFPQNDSGAYLGYHPAEGADVIAWLEKLRKHGAEFLFVPSTSLWWLDYYRSFARHLDRRFRRVAHDADAGVVFDLRNPSPVLESKPQPAGMLWEELCTSLQSLLTDESRAEEVVHMLAPVIRRFVEPAMYQEFYSIWEQHGFHLTPVHFYDPVPDSRKLPPSLWSKDSELPGIDLNAERQLRLLTKVFPRFRRNMTCCRRHRLHCRTSFTSSTACSTGQMR
jgi:hypothetical protein